MVRLSRGGGLLSALSLKLMCGESKFWLVMLWFAFRIKSAYLEGSLHFMFSYDSQCYYQAQVSLWATCGPCGWKLLRENTQEKCCILGFDVLL